MFSSADLIMILNPIITAVLLFGLLLLKDKWFRPAKQYVTYVTQRKGGQPVYHHAVLDRKVDPLEWITSKDSKDKNIFYRIAYVQPVISKTQISTMKPADDGNGVWSMNNGRFENRYAQRDQATNGNENQRPYYQQDNRYNGNRNFAYQNR
jgi:hypothetical protein